MKFRKLLAVLWFATAWATAAVAQHVAFGIAATMLVAVATVHLTFGFFMNWYGTQKGEGFEYHLLVIAITLFLMIRGAGAFSIDRAIASAFASRSGAINSE